MEFPYWRIFLSGKSSIKELNEMDYSTIMKINALLDYQEALRGGLSELYTEEAKKEHELG